MWNELGLPLNIHSNWQQCLQLPVSQSVFSVCFFLSHFLFVTSKYIIFFFLLKTSRGLFGLMFWKWPEFISMGFCSYFPPFFKAVLLNSNSQNPVEERLKMTVSEFLMLQKSKRLLFRLKIPDWSQCIMQEIKFIQIHNKSIQKHFLCIALSQG